jgi:hypothetical protein
MSTTENLPIGQPWLTYLRSMPYGSEYHEGCPIDVSFATRLRDTLRSVFKLPYTSAMDELLLEGMVCSKSRRVPILRLHAPKMDVVCAYNYEYMAVTVICEDGIYRFSDDDIDWDADDVSDNLPRHWKRGHMPRGEGRDNVRTKEFTFIIDGNEHMILARLYSLLRTMSVMV